MLAYFAQHEQKYALPIIRPIRVQRITRVGERLRIEASDGRQWLARAVISATGPWGEPYTPEYEGLDSFAGIQLHSAHYSTAAPFSEMRVAIMGGGNSGAQILVEVSMVAETTWITQHEPAFLADDVDGRVLFERATERLLARPLASAARER